MTGVIHVEVIPSVKSVTAIDTFTSVNLLYVIPALPAELVAAPLNSVSVTCGGSRTHQNFVGIASVFENLVIPEVVIPVGPRSVAGIPRSVAVARIVSFIVSTPYKESVLHLFQVILTLQLVGLFLSLGQNRVLHRRQNPDDGYNHQKFNKGESFRFFIRLVHGRTKLID